MSAEGIGRKLRRAMRRQKMKPADLAARTGKQLGPVAAFDALGWPSR
jgi:hypothetical protein